MKKKIRYIPDWPFWEDDKVVLLIVQHSSSSKDWRNSKRMLFTLETKKRHNYDWSKWLYLKLPGGKLEPGDWIVMTAQKELKEELWVEDLIRDHFSYIYSIASSHKKRKRYLHLVQYLGDCSQVDPHNELVIQKMACIDGNYCSLDEIHSVKRLSADDLQYIKALGKSKYITKPVLEIIPYLLSDQIV